jgi:hypothetical protein
MQELKSKGHAHVAVSFNKLVEAYLPDDDEDDYWDSRTNRVHGLTVGGLPSGGNHGGLQVLYSILYAILTTVACRYCTLCTMHCTLY